MEILQENTILIFEESSETLPTYEQTLQQDEEALPTYEQAIKFKQEVNAVKYFNSERNLNKWQQQKTYFFKKIKTKKPK